MTHFVGYTCPIDGQPWKDCPHSIAEADQYLQDEEIIAVIDRRLVELGVVEKSHTKVMQSAKKRARRKRGH